MNSVQITKLDHTTSTVWKKLAKNLKNTILSPHAMYFFTQKGPKRPKQDFSRNFHGVISCKTKEIL